MSGFTSWLRAVFLGSRPASAAPRQPAGAPTRAEIEDLLAAANVPAAGLAVVENGEVTWAAGYGLLGRRGHRSYVNRDTIFQAASLSKPVTALAALRLVDEGRLDLDADVREYMSLALVEHHILAQDPGPRADVTARLLLQHRGGVVGRGTTPAPSGDGFLDPDRGGGSRRLRHRRGQAVPSLTESWYGAQGAAAVTLTYPPGQRFSYSGAGYLVLQHVIEEITGQSFADYLALVLPDAGARVASFRLHPPSTTNFARGHDEHGRTLPGGYELVPWSAAAGLYATANDMAEILATIVRGGSDFIDASLLQQMADDSLGVFGRTERGVRIIRHGGDNGGYRAAIFGIPSEASGVVVLTNGRSNRGPALRRELVERLRAERRDPVSPSRD